MEVRHRLTAISAIVDHQSVAVVSQPHPSCDLRRLEQQMPKQSRVARLRLPDARNRPFRHHQDMRGRLRMNVPEGEDLIVLVNHVGWNLAGDEFLEQRHER